jgi:hypothetical protein
MATTVKAMTPLATSRAEMSLTGLGNENKFVSICIRLSGRLERRQGRDDVVVIGERERPVRLFPVLVGSSAGWCRGQLR